MFSSISDFVFDRVFIIIEYILHLGDKIEDIRKTICAECDYSVMNSPGDELAG